MYHHCTITVESYLPCKQFVEIARDVSTFFLKISAPAHEKVIFACLSITAPAPSARVFQLEEGMDYMREMDEMLTAKIAVHAMSDGKNPSELKTASTQPSQIEPAPPETGGVASSASQGTRTVIIPAPSLYHHCTVTAPSLHCTITAPSLHHHCKAVALVPAAMPTCEAAPVWLRQMMKRTLTKSRQEYTSWRLMTR